MRMKHNFVIIVWFDIMQASYLVIESVSHPVVLLREMRIQERYDDTDTCSALAAQRD